MDDWSPLARTVALQKYCHERPDGTKETWNDVARRVGRSVCGAAPLSGAETAAVQAAVAARVVMPGGRYLAASGRPFHQVQNCFLLRAEDTSTGWADLMFKSTAALMSGGGIGVDYSALRPKGAPLKTKGGVSSGPLALMHMVNEAGRYIRQGGERRSAIWAGLRWDHDDALDFLEAKTWTDAQRKAKEADPEFPLPLEGTNVSVILDRAFFEAYASGNGWARSIYRMAVESMLKTGEPGFSVDYANKNESLRNACTEATSADDSDVCNLGSANMGRLRTLDEFVEALRACTTLLMAGTLYSDVPYPTVADVRDRNRRIGVGLMGMHDWMLQRGLEYGESPELTRWLNAYVEVTSETAERLARAWGIAVPVACRAIAPTGSIAIVGETTSGIEPIYSVAYKRRYRGTDGVLQHQYVVDPTAKRLIDAGVHPEAIEDAYHLAQTPERRVAFQAYVQTYVDQGISSTVNLPKWGSEHNSEATKDAFAEMLLGYLPKLRGITCFPDGSRGAQPLTSVRYETAMAHEGQVFIEQADVCERSGGGSCGA